MNPTFQIFIIVAITIISVRAATVRVAVSKNEEAASILKSNPTLTYLGQVDGKRFFHENDTVTWYDSDKLCKEMGMTLLSVDNEAEYEFLKSASYPARWVKYWTSAKDSGSRAQYQWGVGEGGQLGSFGKWSDFDQNPAKCVFMDIPSGEWRDYGCNYGFSTVCQL